MNTSCLKRFFLVGALAILPFAAFAGVSDAQGDFEPGYTGPANSDLDVRYAEVKYDATNLYLKAQMWGNIGTSTGASYILGINRGAGTARFAGYSGILFDSVISVPVSGTGVVRDLTNNSAITYTLGSGDFSMVGDTLTVTVPLSSLASKGFTIDQYTWNFWPRVSSPGGLAGISDFAPDGRNAGIEAVPEPATMIALGLGAVSMIRRRRLSK